MDIHKFIGRRRATELQSYGAPAQSQIVTHNVKDKVAQMHLNKVALVTYVIRQLKLMLSLVVVHAWKASSILRIVKMKSLIFSESQHKYIHTAFCSTFYIRLCTL